MIWDVSMPSLDSRKQVPEWKVGGGNGMSLWGWDRDKGQSEEKMTEKSNENLAQSSGKPQTELKMNVPSWQRT